MNTGQRVKGKIGILSLAMMGVIGVFSLRTLPIMAQYGFLAVTYYVLAAILFFIPSAFVCAELATGWPKTGGIYVWISEAFGKRVGFLSIWLEWINNVIAFPANLSFIVVMVSYALFPGLQEHKVFMLGIMLLIFWGATFSNFFGIKFSSTLSNLGLILGAFFPCIMIILLAIFWVFSGHHLAETFKWSNFLPHKNIFHSSYLVGLILGYAGIQIVGFHAQDVDNPQKNYPKAILISTLAILLLSVFGTLAISVVVPHGDVNLLAGVMQGLQSFFVAFHLRWLLPIIAILIGIGVLSS